MFDKLQKIIFFLLVFFLSSQVGLHFWPEFSYVGGVRIDYLSPTFYLLDVLIFLFILFSFPEILKIKIDFKKNIFFKAVFILFLLDVILNIFLVKSSAAHVFGLIKLGELGLLGLLVAKTFTKQDIPLFVRTLSLSAMVSSVLAIWQFINQSSVGGLWYYLGERTFNSSTIGISTVSLNSQILRAYGAFPHPNVLAFFFLATCVFALMRIPHEKKLMWKIFLIAAIVLSSVGLVLTFSRISIFLAGSFLAFYLLSRLGRFGKLGLFGMLAVFIFLARFIPADFLLRGIDFREELFTQSLKILSDNPYLGIGLNNFFIHQGGLIKTISPINFQPPHNIFVVALLSLGLFGWWIVPLGLIKAVRAVWGKIQKSRIKNPIRQAQSKHESQDFYRSILIVLVSIVIIGMFDHFFMTVEQGQIMLALALGLSFVRFKI